MTHPAAVGPLAGVRVLDLSSAVMGPYATQILGDLGAEVIAVEEASGDTNRIMGPGPSRGMSGISLNLLRNKRNVCLNLKSEAGRDAFLRIAATCDVLVTNLRPAPLARLRLDYAAIREVRADIVMCQAHGWPSDGADANKPAYDDVIQASAGIADAFERQSGTFALAPTLVADKVGGLTIVYAVLAAMFHRERTGEGQFVEVPMIDALTSFTLVEHGCAAIPEPPLGPAGYPRVLAAERRPYATTDGWVAVLPYSASNYNDLFREGGRLDLIDDPRVLSAAARVANAADLYALIDPIIATRSSVFWIEYCSRHDIPAGAVRSLDDLVAELPVEQHPTLGAYRQIPPPVRFAATPASVRRHAPMLGEHGREVLREVGLSDDAIDALVGDSPTTE
ncbi:MAG: CoA transferase [Actinobacteria bacterium]|nr:CoA transferase [Actinomycetota bacterium]